MNFLDLIVGSLVNRPPQAAPNLDQLIAALQEPLAPLGERPVQRPPARKQEAPGFEDEGELIRRTIHRLANVRPPVKPVGTYFNPSEQFAQMAAPFSGVSGGPIQWLGGAPGNLAEHYRKLAGFSAINNALVATMNQLNQRREDEIDPTAAQLLMLLLGGGAL